MSTGCTLGVAAALSRDEALWQDFATGDIYLAFAVRAGLVPPGATKMSHPDERALCKTVVLGVNYGMSEAGLARRLDLPLAAARRLLEKHRAAYPDYWRWSDNLAAAAIVGEHSIPRRDGRSSFPSRPTASTPAPPAISLFRATRPR